MYQRWSQIRVKKNSDYNSKNTANDLSEIRREGLSSICKMTCRHNFKKRELSIISDPIEFRTWISRK
ncbi:hypothetical protein CH378_21950 [Leptospira kmetyi]|uniref:Uncharacterized protein n=1 Tax=Leptospira kmetyi TaxID=408139 RepID=A0ABX4N6C9_9LEPT|nr:hypothetical protein CH378_21950 [Leptospira kmetyi]